MNLPRYRHSIPAGIILAVWLCITHTNAQTLLNIDFAANSAGAKSGFAATGQTSNDVWNAYTHYSPRFMPGMPLAPDGRMENLKYADGSVSAVSITVSNAPGVWGNSTGDSMFDSYMFAPNGSNIIVHVTGLEPGRYHFFLYGRADADTASEQNSLFELVSGTNHLGPLTTAGSAGFRAGQPWREHAQFVVFRDVAVEKGDDLKITVAPNPGGVAVLNGLQILSRGTSPPRLTGGSPLANASGPTNIFFSRINYDGTLSSNDARFLVTLDAESRNTNEISALVFEGDLALLSPKLPPGWRLVNEGRRYYLHASEPGRHQLEFQLAAKVQINEPWRLVNFIGPSAAIATVTARATEPESSVQLLSGTLLQSSHTNSAYIQGALGSGQKLLLGWRGKEAEINRDAVITVASRFTGHLAATAIRLVSEFQFDVVQSRVQKLRIAIPPAQSLTQFKGEQVRDWRVIKENGQSILQIEFLKPMEKSFALTLTTEQAVNSLPVTASLAMPEPLDVQRENGTLSMVAEDVTAQLGSITGLRQINAGQDELAAYRFNARPASLTASISRSEPRLTVADWATVLLEENRLLAVHRLSLAVERAGIYSLQLNPQPGYTVAEVTGEGVDDWKLSDGKLLVSFRKKLLGSRELSVQLERSLTNTPNEVVVLPLGIDAAAKQTTWVGIGSIPGISVKTATVTGIKEIPVNALPSRNDQTQQAKDNAAQIALGAPTLAFRGEIPDWQITLAAERLTPRVAAQVFNLITIGEGIVGGSATIRYSIANQGVQQFQVRVPSHWRNIEFTGPNIRRQDNVSNVWTLSLQDKAWGGYTLVATYDYAFDVKQASLDAAGAHPLGVEREEGAVAVTATPSLTLTMPSIKEPLRQIDPSELTDADRALINRPVLLAARYHGNDFALSLNLTRHEEIAALEAVTDRAQLTSVITPTGEMLTQASFMVKNNERQFQKFQLPAGATLWGVAVNGLPAKADKDGDWLLIPLPRVADRNQAFAVDIKYAQQTDGTGGLLPKQLKLSAPRTDMAGTYAEWELFVPPTKHISNFGGNMTVARGVVYGARDAWREFINVYKDVWHNYGQRILFAGFGCLFIALLVWFGKAHGFKGIGQALAVCTVIAILGGMMLPALSKAKAKAQRIKSVNNLKNIGLAARVYSSEKGDVLPASIDDLMPYLGTDRILVDPETGERYTYVGAGKTESMPQAIIAYSSDKNGHREVLMADGSVQQTTEARFRDLLANEDAAKKEADSASAAGLGGAVKPASTSEPALMRRYGMSPRSPAENPPVNLPRVQTIAVAGAALTTAGQSNNKDPGSLGFGVIPTATGIKSLSIEIPKSGRAFQFTKVLNLGGEPATITASLMSARAFTAWQTLLQLIGFVVGMAIVWWQWQRVQPRPLWLAIGAAVTLVSVANFLLIWRALHLVLIVGFPALLLGVLIWVAAQLKHAAPEEPQDNTGLPPETSATSLTSAIIFALALLGAKANAAETDSLLRIPPAVIQTTNSASIVSASYSGTARDQAAVMEVNIELISNGTNQMIALFGKDVAVSEFASITGDARIWRQGDQIGVLLPNPGATSLRMKILARLTGDITRRELSFGIPPALSSKVSLAIDEPEAEIEFPSAVSVQRILEGDSTRVEAVVGAVERLSLSWTPRFKRTADAGATVFAQQTALITFQNGVIDTHSILDYQIPQGELRELRIKLPEGRRLLRVTGDSMRSWQLAATNRNELVVELLRGVSSNYRLELELEQSLGTLPSITVIALPHSLDAKRETGLFAIKRSDELELQPNTTPELSQTDGAELAKLMEIKSDELIGAWRFLRSGFDLPVKAALLKPKIEVFARHQFTVGNEQVAISSRLDFEITQAGIFSLQVGIPPGSQIKAVRCDAMQDWVESEENGARRLILTLRERALGKIAVLVEATQALTNLPPILNLTAPFPEDAAKISGILSVSGEAGVGIKTANLASLVEIPATTLASDDFLRIDPTRLQNSGGILAFKFSPVESPAAQPWNLAVATELLPAWVRAEIVNLVNVGETLINGRTLVRYEIENAPVKEFQIRVPAGWQNVDLTGDGIRRKDETNKTWRVELQNRVRGQYQLVIQWERPRTATNSFIITGPETLGTERETGIIGISSSAQLQIGINQASDELQRIDASEIPSWAQSSISGIAEGGTVVNYRYLRSGWQLDLNLQRFDEAAVLQALVEQAELRSVIADDGQLMTQMELTVRNNGRQNLALTLPPGMQLWSAFVGGVPVRPTKRGDALLLPLENSGAANAPITVELTYVGKTRFPEGNGPVALISPQLDVPLKNARWQVFLPPDYDYSDFHGSMSYESADLVAISQDFTRAEYSRQEEEKSSLLNGQAIDSLRQARSNLASGRYADAQNIISRAKTKALEDNNAVVELKELEKELNQVQSGRLIRAQQDYFAANNTHLSLQPAVTRNTPLFDSKVAEQQIERLQKAQSVVATRVQPLRVNLPTRGVRYAFTQVLQTEVNRPLKVEFNAANDRRMGWLKQATLWGGGFLLLWAMSFVICARTRTSKIPFAPEQSATPAPAD